MSVVVNINEYRGKGVLTLARELLIAASKGKIAGIRVAVYCKDGGVKRSVAGNIAGGAAGEDCCPPGIPCAHRTRQ